MAGSNTWLIAGERHHEPVLWRMLTHAASMGADTDAAIAQALEEAKAASAAQAEALNARLDAQLAESEAQIGRAHV